MNNLSDLVKEYEDKERTPKEGFVTDYWGCRTSIKHYNSIQPFNNKVLGFPDPDDGILHELIEYIGSGYAIKNCKKSFTCIELGAGNGVWCARTGLAARRKGVKEINLTAVEADPTKAKWIQENLNENNLNSEIYDDCKTTILNNAISDKKGVMYFPIVSNPDKDYGNVPSNENNEKDYRGASFKNFKIDAISLKDLITSPVDLLHVDIQGGERDLLIKTIEHLNKFVKVLVLGTHSRKIEGDMFELFFNNQWTLLLENHCLFKYDVNIPTLEGMTIKDGNQVWVNTKLT